MQGPCSLDWALKFNIILLLDNNIYDTARACIRIICTCSPNIIIIEIIVSNLAELAVIIIARVMVNLIADNLIRGISYNIKFYRPTHLAYVPYLGHSQ